MRSYISPMKWRHFSFKHNVYTHLTHINYWCPPTFLVFHYLGGRGGYLYYPSSCLPTANGPLYPHMPYDQCASPPIFIPKIPVPYQNRNLSPTCMHIIPACLQQGDQRNNPPNSIYPPPLLVIPMGWAVKYFLLWFFISTLGCNASSVTKVHGCFSSMGSRWSRREAGRSRWVDLWLWNYIEMVAI